MAIGALAVALAGLTSTGPARVLVLILSAAALFTIGVARRFHRRWIRYACRIFAASLLVTSLAVIYFSENPTDEKLPSHDSAGPAPTARTSTTTTQTTTSTPRTPTTSAEPTRPRETVSVHKGSSSTALGGDVRIAVTSWYESYVVIQFTSDLKSCSAYPNIGEQKIFRGKDNGETSLYKVFLASIAPDPVATFEIEEIATDNYLTTQFAC